MIGYYVVALWDPCAACEAQRFENFCEWSALSLLPRLGEEEEGSEAGRHLRSRQAWGDVVG